MQVAEWKQQIADARVKLPGFLVKANQMAIDNTPIDLQEISNIAAVNEKAAEQFFSIVSGEDIYFQPNFQGFIDNLHVQKYAPATIHAYSTDVEYFIKTFDRHSKLTTRSVRDWIKAQRAAGRTDGVMYRVLCKSVKKFIAYIDYKFNIKTDVDLSLPKFDQVPSNKTDRKDIDNEGFGKLYNAAIKNKDNQIQDFLMIAAFAGLRINEIGDIKKSDVVTIDKIRSIKITKSKTAAGIRTVPIHRSLLGLIDDLCKGKGDDEYLFDIPRDVKRPTGAIVARFSKLKTSLGFGADITFHSARHSVDTALLRAGVEPKLVSQIMGHAIKGNESLKTYYQGAHLLQLKQAIDKIHWPALNTGTLAHMFEE